MMLRPNPGRPPIDLTELQARLVSTGLEVEASRDARYKRDIIEQLIFVYEPFIGRAEVSGEELESLDHLVRSYAQGARVLVSDREAGAFVEFYFFPDEDIFIGEVYPGDPGPESVLAMQIALALECVAEGE